jgi:hypothetical protein
MKLTAVLSDPPEGVALGKPVLAPGLLRLPVVAGEKAKPGLDNLIVELFAEAQRKGKDGKVMKRKYSAGFLPAVPVTIVTK